MATSPIYSWPEPDNTDLVKNGALAIRTLGDAIDTTMGTMVAKTIVDAKGDLIAATAADTVARLAVGTNGQTLVADSSTATGLKWATPASGSSGLTLIQRSSFSSVANTGTTFDGVFSSTYVNYQIIFETFGSATAADDLHFQMRYAGPTTQVGYTTQLVQNEVGSTSWTIVTGNPGDQIVLCTDATVNNPYVGTLNAMIPSSSGNGQVYGFGTESYNCQMSMQFGNSNIGRVYTGFILKSASANITGTVAVYGLAKS